jgi:hypothetical protein
VCEKQSVILESIFEHGKLAVCIDLETLPGRVVDHPCALGTPGLVFGHDGLVSRARYRSNTILRQTLENNLFLNFATLLNEAR